MQGIGHGTSNSSFNFWSSSFSLWLKPSQTLNTSFVLPLGSSPQEIAKSSKSYNLPHRPIRSKQNRVQLYLHVVSSKALPGSSLLWYIWGPRLSLMAHGSSQSRNSPNLNTRSRIRVWVCPSAPPMFLSAPAGQRLVCIHHVSETSSLRSCPCMWIPGV